MWVKIYQWKNGWFWLAERHLIKINITRSIMKAWQLVILLDNGWYTKKYWLCWIYAHPVHHRFWLALFVHLNWRSTKYKLIHLTWIVLKLNEMSTMYLINIQYNIIIIDCRRGEHGKLSLLENQCRPQLRLGQHWFSRGDNFHVTMLPSRAVNIYIISPWIVLC